MHDHTGISKESANQKVVIRNRYAEMEYESMEQAAASLSKIGVYSKDQILRMLRDRSAYINGYVVTYP